MSETYVSLFPDEPGTLDAALNPRRPRRSPRRTVRRATPNAMQLTFDDMAEMVAAAKENEAVAWEFLLSDDRDMLLHKRLGKIVGISEHHVADKLGQLEAHFVRSWKPKQPPKPTGDPAKDAERAERAKHTSCKTWWNRTVGQPIANEARRQQLILRGLPGHLTWSKAYSAACVGCVPGQQPTVEAVARELARANSKLPNPTPTPQVWRNAQALVQAHKQSINVTSECDVVTSTDHDNLEDVVEDAGLLDLMAELTETDRVWLAKYASGEASEDDLPVRLALRHARAQAKRSGEIKEQPVTEATEAA